MATNENLIPIPGRLHSVANEKHVAGADEIYDDDLSKSQATINTQVAYLDSDGGPAVVPEFDPQADTIWNKAQVLSETQKAQARENIGVEESLQKTMNMAAMMMLANFSGLPTKVGNPEWKYVLTDIQDRILFGKTQNNTWTFGDDTDDLMDAIIEQYAQDDTLFSNMYRLSVVLSLVRMSGTLSEIQNPEWLWVVVDSEYKILMGIKTDYTWYLGASINETLDCAVSTYAVAGATQGIYNNRPTSPNIGQMYFCTDKQTTEGQTNGISIYWNGTAWVDALGRTVS